MIDCWLITGGRRDNIGAATAVLNRFQVSTIQIADPDPWSATLRGLVQQAQSAGIPVGSGNQPVSVDGVTVSLAADGRSWLVHAGRAVVAIVSPETSWLSLPGDLDGAIFTSGGPADWQGPGQGFSVIQVAANSRQGLPVRAVLHALAGAPLLRTDRLGTLELSADDGRFEPAS